MDVGGPGSQPWAVRAEQALLPDQHLGQGRGPRVPWRLNATQFRPEGRGRVFLLDQRSDMEFLEVLTEHLDRVMLVRGGGREVITIYS